MEHERSHLSIPSTKGANSDPNHFQNDNPSKIVQQLHREFQSIVNDARKRFKEGGSLRSLGLEKQAIHRNSKPYLESIGHSKQTEKKEGSEFETLVLPKILRKKPRNHSNFDVIRLSMILICRPRLCARG